MSKWLIAAILTAMVGVAAQAETTPSAGQPFCLKREELKEFLLAMIKKDTQWMNQLKSCGMLAPNIKVAIIEEYESQTDILHVIKIRAFGAGTSAVGYTLSIGIK